MYARIGSRCFATQVPKFVATVGSAHLPKSISEALRCERRFGQDILPYGAWDEIASDLSDSISKVSILHPHLTV